MANLVTGAMSSIIPKLGELLKEEYNLQTRVKERIRSLTLELEGTKGALDKVAEVPWEQLDKQVKFWVREVRESSYDMEDVLDTYLVHVQGRDSAKQRSSLERFREKIGNLFKKSKARRKISVSGKDIMTHLYEVTERCHRYRVDDIIASRTASSSTVDPRLSAMYNKVKDLIGIDKSSSQLISMLHLLQRGSVLNANAKMKIVSVVGVGGLGKTTLAKAVYDKHKGDFDRGAFVPVGRNPDLKKVFQQILIGLDKERYMQFNFGQFSEIYQFIDELKGFLLQKRYFIVIDDVWETQSWDIIKLAIDDENNCGSRIIVTTRKMDVATKAVVIYKLQPLSDDSSKELFYTRMYGDEGSHVDNKPNGISNKILKKCGGIPLAIITMASLLADKPKDRWPEIYKTIGFGHKDSKEDENTTIRILSFSYFDLPSHLRTCLLYLGAFREDSIINKSALIWKWIAEGFIHEQQGTWLFETGEGYFNDLINRSLIQGLDGGIYGPDSVIVSCCVHDVVLDFIRFMLHEENFSTILDNNVKDTPSLSPPPVRRLVHHNRTMRHTTTHQANNHFNDKMRTVRSFSAQGCAIESWTLLSRFTLLRVLAIEECNPSDGCCLHVEHVGNLLHLRYLSLSGTRIQRISGEIGGLRFLQTLDLLRSGIEETPSSSSLPRQLVCLRITFDLSSGPADKNGEVGWVGRLTSLEELLIHERYQWKEIGSLRELRGLNASIDMDDDESMRDFVDSISHLNKLQHLEIRGSRFQIVEWEATRFVLLLPRQLRYFNGMYIIFHKMPPCINPCGLPNLSHLYLSLSDMDEQDLQNLGGLPELRFLGLDLTGCSATISNINDSNNVVYFPKLRFFQLWGAMVLLFVANKKEEDNKKVVSFHLWDGCSDDMSVTFDSDDDHGLQMPMRIALFDSEGNGHENREGSIFIDKEGASTAPCLRFMPSLQVLKFEVRGKAAQDHRYCDNLMGWEYVSSLREISVRIYKPSDVDAVELDKVEAALRQSTDEHPNRPTLHLKIW